MSSQREVPTLYWQAIVAHYLVVLQQGGMSHLFDSIVAGPTARRANVLASKCEYTPFRYTPLVNVPDTWPLETKQ